LPQQRLASLLQLLDVVDPAQHVGEVVDGPRERGGRALADGRDDVFRFLEFVVARLEHTPDAQGILLLVGVALAPAEAVQKLRELGEIQVVQCVEHPLVERTRLARKTPAQLVELRVRLDGIVGKHLTEHLHLLDLRERHIGIGQPASVKLGNAGSAQCGESILDDGDDSPVLLCERTRLLRVKHVIQPEVLTVFQSPKDLAHVLGVRLGLCRHQLGAPCRARIGVLLKRVPDAGAAVEMLLKQSQIPALFAGGGRSADGCGTELFRTDAMRHSGLMSALLSTNVPGRDAAQ
jgi:hypothetical protein